MSERYAICQFYVPFVMGGDVWQFRRFKVEAEDCELIKGFKGFVAKHKRRYTVYELATGGKLGEGHTRQAAIFDANKNIEETPDLKEQIQKLGDTSRFEEVSVEEAYSRLDKIAAEEKARKKRKKVPG